MLKIFIKNNNKKVNNSKTVTDSFLNYLENYDSDTIMMVFSKMTDHEQRVLLTRYTDLLNHTVNTIHKNEEVEFYNTVGKYKRIMKKLVENQPIKNEFLTFLESYKDEDILKAYEQLSECDQEIIKLRYGDILNPVVHKIPEKERLQLYSNIIPRFKRKLKNISEGKTRETVDKFLSYIAKYNHEEIMMAFNQLDDYSKEIIRLRYGDILNPVVRPLSKEHKDKFYGSVIPKFRNRLAKLNKQKEKEERFIEDSNQFTKDDFLRISELFGNDLFVEITKSMPLEKGVVASLYLGLVGKEHTIIEISKFLGLPFDDVSLYTKEVLEQIKDEISKNINATKVKKK